ncbi:pentatricopeptide repeat-containing protein 2, mitochondrial-like [Contarinia nasturtii]|uniref:pentatricopeptide repeat-containing protein 2, mitochondrial-like n=1 Tax=Contarinia nasturtii TaxID=265458 RepID=UPI0012D45585|nr:pentatricopeptide repeat-containing protein 2, mitochondrial-like [Contarinia nasturtii]
MILNNLRIFRHSLHHNALTVGSMRTLYSEKDLGVSDYESRRLEAVKRGGEYCQPDTVLKKMKFQLRSENIEELIQTLKIWIHVVDTKQCKKHFSLLKDCLDFIYNNPHPDPAKKNYNFPPTVMRMFHLLNMPDEALNIAANIKNKDMFNQHNSTIILCDLLFNNGMYKELIYVVENANAVNAKRGMKSSYLQNCITFAACYKLNTQDHLSYALEIWNKSVKEHQLSQAINFLCMNAINLNQPEIALEILRPSDKHFTSLYIRLIALSDCGKYAEAAQVLRSGLNQQIFSNIPASVVNRIRQNLNKCLPAEDADNFNNLLNEVQHQKTKITIDEILCWPIALNLKKFDIDRHRYHQTN